MSRIIIPSLAFLSLAISTTAWASSDFNLHVPKDTQRSVCVIESDQDEGMGTGFLFGSKNWVYLVTAKHVVLNPVFDGVRPRIVEQRRLIDLGKLKSISQIPADLFGFFEY
jgi:hypothetical protein